MASQKTRFIYKSHRNLRSDECSEDELQKTPRYFVQLFLCLSRACLGKLIVRV